jgi:hypothetical protein
MDGRENRQTNMDVILAVVRWSRRKSNSAFIRRHASGDGEFRQEQ